MALDSYRDKTVEHKRRSIDTGARKATLTDLGDIRIGGDPIVYETDLEEFHDVEVPQFPIVFDPRDDVRVGDILVIGTIQHEVMRVDTPRFPPGYGEAIIKRMEVHR